MQEEMGSNENMVSDQIHAKLKKCIKQYQECLTPGAKN